MLGGTRLNEAGDAGTLFFCRVCLHPQVDVMGDVVNYLILRGEGSDYEYIALAVMCTSAWD